MAVTCSMVCLYLCGIQGRRATSLGAQRGWPNRSAGALAGTDRQAGRDAHVYTCMVIVYTFAKGYDSAQCTNMAVIRKFVAEKLDPTYSQSTAQRGISA